MPQRRGRSADCERRSALGPAIDDIAQEEFGTALIGILIAALVVSVVPLGASSPDLVTVYEHGEGITYWPVRWRAPIEYVYRAL